MSGLPLKLGRKVGTYKGKLFRSLWELSFYKHLEEQGVDISTVTHEPLALPYVFRGRRRTYHPDFLVPSWGMLVEVKCERELARARGKYVRRAKFEAAEAHCASNGLVFKVMTERSFRIVPGRIARRDPDVVWIKGRPR